ncbi:Venom allergen 3 [Pseudolycoriella hygida]|uniref:Venom allergen 3 n=1 Tax=Pseudolycoriella hygida TaxID=35572 RepID=A0A9Q0MNZ2_9DIPT|nr:Venom allergen 3 [Pseudolycoriella hygida]
MSWKITIHTFLMIIVLVPVFRSITTENTTQKPKTPNPSTRTTPPKNSPPKGNPSKTLKAATPKVTASKATAPKANVPKTKVLKANVPKSNVPKANVPKANVPKANVPKANAPKVNVPKANVPNANLPNPTSGYCNIKSCKNPSEHTMCKFKSAVPSLKRCGEKYEVGLSDELKQYIVDRHNEIRQLVASGNEIRGKPGPQPSAENMPDLIWDKKLETVAQRWANQCNLGRDKCRNVNRFSVGQNIATTSRIGNSLTVATSVEGFINSWYNEVQELNAHKAFPITITQDAHTAEYTQMVWSMTKHIGCGFIKYNHGLWLNYYLVCNYGPSGNILGQKIYD